MKGGQLAQRLRYASNGILTAFRRERSMRTHGLAAAGVATYLLANGAPLLWWAIVGLAIGLVLVAELANTAIETLADHLHPEQHAEIGVAKDVAAGAVLIASLVAVLVGVAYLLS